MTFETASRTGMCSLILRRPLIRSSIACMELMVLRYCIIGFWVQVHEQITLKWAAGRTGRRLISSRSATMRRDNRIKESRISSSSLSVRLLSSGVYTRFRLNSSLFPCGEISNLESAGTQTCLLSVKYSWLNKPSVRLVFRRNSICVQYYLS